MRTNAVLLTSYYDNFRRKIYHVLHIRKVDRRGVWRAGKDGGKSGTHPLG